MSGDELVNESVILPVSVILFLNRLISKFSEHVFCSVAVFPFLLSFLFVKHVFIFLLAQQRDQQI